MRPSRFLCVLSVALATVALPLHAGPVDPKSTSFLTSDRVRLRVFEAGVDRPGQPVIAFVPGWSMPGSIWGRQAELLSATHKVAVLDPRGQGESPVPRNGFNIERRAEDLHDFVRRYAPVVLVTWSLASLEALLYIRTHGEYDLQGLVIVDSSVGEISTLVEPPPTLPPLPGPVLTFTEELRQDRFRALDNFVRDIFKTPQPEYALAALRDSAMRMPLEASLSIFPGNRIPRERWRETVNAFTRPLLYAVTPQYQGQAEALKRNRPATRIEVFDKAGHALFVDEPDRFATLLAGFLRENGLAGAN